MKLTIIKNRRNAFSMTEMLVAVSLLSFVFSSFYMGLSASFTMLETARQNLRATQILVERTETLRLLKWSQVTEPDFVPPTFLETYDPRDGTSMAYSGKITIEPLSGSENYSTEMRRVRVDLSWKSGDVVRSRSMHTLISSEGIQNYVF